MRDIEEIKKSTCLRNIRTGMDGFSADIHIGGWDGSFIFSYGGGWKHASVSPYAKRILPTWNDMCRIKEMCWNDNEAVIQIHPAKSEYVNNVGNCLHLWRCYYKDMLLPPNVFVGILDGMTRKRMLEEIKAAYELAGEKYE